MLGIKSLFEALFINTANLNIYKQDGKIHRTREFLIIIKTVP